MNVPLIFTNMLGFIFVKNRGTSHGKARDPQRFHKINQVLVPSKPRSDDQNQIFKACVPQQNTPRKIKGNIRWAIGIMCVDYCWLWLPQDWCWWIVCFLASYFAGYVLEMEDSKGTCWSGKSSQTIGGLAPILRHVWHTQLINSDTFWGSVSRQTVTNFTCPLQGGTQFSISFDRYNELIAT